MSELKDKSTMLWKLNYGNEAPPVPSRTRYVKLSDALEYSDQQNKDAKTKARVDFQIWEATDIEITRLEKENKELREFIKWRNGIDFDSEEIKRQFNLWKSKN